MLNPAAAAAAAAAARHPVSNPIKLFYNHQNILQLCSVNTIFLFLYANIFFPLLDFLKTKVSRDALIPSLLSKYKNYF